MKDTVRNLLNDSIYKLQSMRKEKMTLVDRIKLETSIVKLELAKDLIYHFLNN